MHGTHGTHAVKEQNLFEIPTAFVVWQIRGNGGGYLRGQVGKARSAPLMCLHRHQQRRRPAASVRACPRPGSRSSSARPTRTGSQRSSQCFPLRCAHCPLLPPNRPVILFLELVARRCIHPQDLAFAFCAHSPSNSWRSPRRASARRQLLLPQLAHVLTGVLALLALRDCWCARLLVRAPQEKHRCAATNSCGRRKKASPWEAGARFPTGTNQRRKLLYSCIYVLYRQPQPHRDTHTKLND
jgi:hypothetical protein